MVWVLSFMPSGAIPTIGLTALQVFQKIGTPLVKEAKAPTHGSPPSLRQMG